MDHMLFTSGNRYAGDITSTKWFTKSDWKVKNAFFWDILTLLEAGNNCFCQS